jgi:hypothetical protein
MLGTTMFQPTGTNVFHQRWKMSGTYGKSDIKRNISKNITLMTISSGGPRPHKTQSNSCDLLNGAPGPIAVWVCKPLNTYYPEREIVGP